MPAPDLLTIYKFEDAVESAAESILRDEGDFENVYSARSEQEAIFPLIAIKYIHGAATGKQKAFSSTDVRDISFRFQLVFAVETARTENAPDHAPYRAKIRVLMMQFVTHFNSRLLYLNIANLTDGGNTPEVRGEDDTDISTMTYNGVMQIRDTAWPS